MAFSARARDIDALSTQTLKTTSDHALFLESAMRCYDLASLWNMQQPVSVMHQEANNGGYTLEQAGSVRHIRVSKQ